MMTMLFSKHTTNEALKQYQRVLKLTNSELAKLLHVSTWTVESWRKPKTARSFRPCPRMAVLTCRLFYESTTALSQAQAELSPTEKG